MRKYIPFQPLRDPHKIWLHLYSDRYRRLKKLVSTKRMDESTYWLFFNELNTM